MIGTQWGRFREDDVGISIACCFCFLQLIVTCNLGAFGVTRKNCALSSLMKLGISKLTHDVH